ncbi:hypothetical protein L1987_10484 [Smallanthus sonchifolius]|uniref:Uncharacterized protein n=1 Tax=Smallanthus sonchifolius TaxID=185202 RepID=A0ACB9JS78_9ASTR|nr:hypothetical protein L1987_10484 [Smallanthus sonchifolius]
MHGLSFAMDVKFDELAKWNTRGEGKHELAAEFINEVGSTSNSGPPASDDDSDEGPNGEELSPNNEGGMGTPTPNRANARFSHTPESKTPKGKIGMKPPTFAAGSEYVRQHPSMLRFHGLQWVMVTEPAG